MAKEHRKNVTGHATDGEKKVFREHLEQKRLKKAKAFIARCHAAEKRREILAAQLGYEVGQQQEPSCLETMRAQEGEKRKPRRIVAYCPTIWLFDFFLLVRIVILARFLVTENQECFPVVEAFLESACFRYIRTKRYALSVDWEATVRSSHICSSS